MALDENFIMRTMMEISDKVATIGGKIDGFIAGQANLEAKYTSLEVRVKGVETSTETLKDKWSSVQWVVYGGMAVFSAGAGLFWVVGWPILKNKFGL